MEQQLLIQRVKPGHLNKVNVFFHSWMLIFNFSSHYSFFNKKESLINYLVIMTSVVGIGCLLVSYF